MTNGMFFNNSKSPSELPFFAVLIKRHLYSFAVFLFVTGIIFRNATWMCSLLNVIFIITGRQFNPEFRLIGFEMVGTGLLLFGFLLVLYKMSGGENTIFTKKQFLVTAPLAILALYWHILFQNMVNVPITDDYFTFLNFLNSFLHITNPAEKWNRLYAPYVETRNVITKCIAITSWKLTGQVNFKGFIILINLALTGIGYLLYKAPERLNIKSFLIIPIFLVVFQYSYYDAQVWTTSGIHNILTMFFVFLTFFFLKKNTAFFFIAAVLSAILAGFTYGNGLFVFPIGIIILFLNQQKFRLMVWLVLFLVVIGFYFYDYVPVRSSSVFVSLNPFLLISYTLVFLGSAFQFMYLIELPFIAGSFMLFLFGLLTLKKYYVLNPFNYCILLYIVLSATMAAFFRFDNQQGIQQALSNRYVLYSCMALCSLIIALTEIYSAVFTKKTMSWLLAGSMVYYLLSGFFFYPEVVIRKNKLIELSNRVKNNQPVTFLSPVIPEGADTIVKTAMQNGIYLP